MGGGVLLDGLVFPFTRCIRYETSADTFFENVTNTRRLNLFSFLGVFKIMFSSIRVDPSRIDAIFLCSQEQEKRDHFNPLSAQPFVKQAGFAMIE